MSSVMVHSHTSIHWFTYFYLGSTTWCVFYVQLPSKWHKFIRDALLPKISTLGLGVSLILRWFPGRRWAVCDGSLKWSTTQKKRKIIIGPTQHRVSTKKTHVHWNARWFSISFHHYGACLTSHLQPIIARNDIKSSKCGTTGYKLKSESWVFHVGRSRSSVLYSSVIEPEHQYQPPRKNDVSKSSAIRWKGTELLLDPSTILCRLLNFSVLIIGAHWSMISCFMFSSCINNNFNSN